VRRDWQQAFRRWQRHDRLPRRHNQRTRQPCDPWKTCTEELWNKIGLFGIQDHTLPRHCTFLSHRWPISFKPTPKVMLSAAYWF